MAIDKSYYTIITDVGKAKIANASVTGNKVGFVKIQLGDGGGSEYTPTESQTALKNVVWEGNIGNTTTDETAPNCIILESLIPSSVGGFMIREIGYLDDEDICEGNQFGIVYFGNPSFCSSFHLVPITYLSNEITMYEIIQRKETLQQQILNEKDEK